jgi:hypothetical protein
MGPGAPDLVCDIPWYRQIRAERPKAWLSADKTGDTVAFSTSQAVTAVAGGYVRESRSHVYEFPLVVVDLKNGTDRQALLSVPFDGNLIVPTNFSGDRDHFSTFGPYMLGVTRLHFDGNSLELTLGTEGTAVGVTFDLDPKDGTRP